jgi:hypothetical protein
VSTFLDLVVVAVEADDVVTFSTERDTPVGIRRPVVIVETIADVPYLLIKLADSTTTERASEFPVPAEL